MSFIPRKQPIHNLPSFRYGLNDKQEDSEISDLEIADIENFTVEEDTIKSAYGYVQYDQDIEEGPVWGLYQFVKSDGTRVFIRQIGAKLQYDDNGIGVWEDCTLPTAGSPASTLTLTQSQPTFVTLNDIVLFSNGYENVLSSTDGITWTARETLPKSKVIASNGANRILFMGQPAAPSRFEWSNINDPLTVGASSWAYVDPNNGEDIIGHGLTAQGTNIIFKTNSFYEISAFVDDGIIDINFIGKFRIAGHHTIKTTEDSIIAAGLDGIYELFGGVMRKISGKIATTGRNMVVRPDLMTAVYIDRKYFLAMPDADIDDDYNSQEYIVYRDLRREDATQPYVITRNRRYFGCYAIREDVTTKDRDIKLFAGSSVNTTAGSPASSGSVVVRINYQREAGLTQGLNGQTQPCYLLTKYYTDDIPYFTKRFKKAMIDLKVEQDTTLTIGYRFQSIGTFTEVEQTVLASSIDWIYDSGETGGFSEGYNFYGSALEKLFIDIENEEKPRGIQFKITTNQINDVTILGLAYQMRVKNKFR